MSQINGKFHSWSDSIFLAAKLDRSNPPIDKRTWKENYVFLVRRKINKQNSNCFYSFGTPIDNVKFVHRFFFQWHLSYISKIWSALSQNNPVTVRADATKYVWFLSQVNVNKVGHASPPASPPAKTSSKVMLRFRYFVVQCGLKWNQKCRIKIHWASVFSVYLVHL